MTWNVPEFWQMVANGNNVLALIRNKRPRPIILCDTCNGEIEDYSKGQVILLNDDLISKVNIIHRSCFNPDDQVVGFIDIQPFMRGLTR